MRKREEHAAGRTQNRQDFHIPNIRDISLDMTLIVRPIHGAYTNEQSESIEKANNLMQNTSEVLNLTAQGRV